MKGVANVTVIVSVSFRNIIIYTFQYFQKHFKVCIHLNVLFKHLTVNIDCSRIFPVFSSHSQTKNIVMNKIKKGYLCFGTS